MRTKLSKRILSVFLAALMVLTSVPIMSISAFADFEVSSTDSDLAEVQTAMNRLETKLTTDGIYANILPAYNAYVDAQKAVDAYTYGGETDALNGIASALNTAIDNMTEWNGIKGTAVPSFEGDDSGSKSNTYVEGVTYSNVLWSPTATESNSKHEASATESVVHRVYFPETTLLYDGVNDTLMPVMGMASVNAKKTRYVYASYPTTSSASTSSAPDNAQFLLTNYWTDRGGETLDYAWTMSDSSTQANGAGYNNESGFRGNQTTTHRSSELKYSTNWIGTFTSGTTKYFGNVLKFVSKADTGYSSYQLKWYFSSGDGANSSESNSTVLDCSASSSSTSTVIRVINYAELIKAVQTAQNKLKDGVALSDYSEGSLVDFFTTIDAATSFDPNSYFTSSNDYEGCSKAIQTQKSNLASLTLPSGNASEYQSLRDAMNELVRNTYSLGNQGYTQEAWDNFVDAYEAARTIMGNVNDKGYKQAGAAETAATNLTTYYEALANSLDKVDVSQLIYAIDAFYAMDNIFTEETYNNAVAVIEDVKAQVWGSAENYGVPAMAPNNTEENVDFVQEQFLRLQTATKDLDIDSETLVKLSSAELWSLEQAMDLENQIEDTTAYSNYTTFQTALADAKTYLASQKTDDFLDFDTEYARYVAIVQEVVDAYNALAYSFTRIPDGSVANTGVNDSITTLEAHKNSSNYNWYIDFSIPRSGLIIKTTREAQTVAYGTAYLTYTINIDNNIDKENNCLDSITIAHKSTDSDSPDANTEINSKSATSTPSALSDTQKATYAGGLSSDGFSLSNFRVTGQNNNRKDYYAVTEGGVKLTSRTSDTDEYSTLLGTTTGANANPATGAIALQPGAKGDASITLAGDMCVDIPALESEELTATTLPSTREIIFENHYFGATFVWNTQPQLAWAGYGFLTSKTNDETMYSKVTVLDIAPLVELVAQCDDIVAEVDDMIATAGSNKYTDTTWENFTKALTTAKTNLDYKAIGATANGLSNLLTNCKKRYTNLWEAKEALTVKTFDNTFSYKDASGNDVSKVITVTWGESLADHASEINTIETPSYVSGAYTYTFDAWEPQLDDISSPVYSTATYTAVYTETINNADWAAYNTAKAQLTGALVDNTYLVSDLQSLSTSIDGLTYFLYDDAQKATVMADAQDAIDAETNTMLALKDTLVASAAELQLDTAKALAEEAKANGGDGDRYDLTVFDYEFTQNVDFKVANSGTDDDTLTVAGLVFATQEELDASIKAYLENMPVKTYAITLNGETVVEDVPFGTAVIVNSDGTYELNVDDLDANSDGTIVAWNYSYDAPSRDGAGATTPKYMISSSSFGFIVKGDTFLTTAETENATDSYVVTVKTDFGKIIDVAVVTDSYTMPTAPSYAGYIFDSYDNGASAGSNVAISADTTIIANYTAKTVDTYTIDICASYDDFWDSKYTEEVHAYNEKVTVSSEDAYCWVISSYLEDDDLFTYRVVSFSSEYSFYACENIAIDDWDDLTGNAIFPLTEDEYEDVVLGSTQLNTVEGTKILDGTVSAKLSYGEIMVDGAGNYILATATSSNGSYKKALESPKATVSSLESVIASADSKEFGMIGTFTLPEDYSIVECGFLFTNDLSVTDMTVDNVGTNNIVRFKASRYTCGNQFVINVGNPSSTVTFKFTPYAIVKDADGNVTTVYGATRSDSNNF